MEEGKATDHPEPSSPEELQGKRPRRGQGSRAHGHYWALAIAAPTRFPRTRLKGSERLRLETLSGSDRGGKKLEAAAATAAGLGRASRRCHLHLARSLGRVGERGRWARRPVARQAGRQAGRPAFGLKGLSPGLCALPCTPGTWQATTRADSGRWKFGVSGSGRTAEKGSGFPQEKGRR